MTTSLIWMTRSLTAPRASRRKRSSALFHSGLSPSALVCSPAYPRRNDASAQPRLSAKRAARAAAYNSDDDEDDESSLPAGLDPRRPEPAPIEGQVDATREELEAAGEMEDDEDEDEDDAETLKPGQLEDLRAVEKRMRTAARVLSHWKELGAEAGMCASSLLCWSPRSTD